MTAHQRSHAKFAGVQKEEEEDDIDEENDTDERYSFYYFRLCSHSSLQVIQAKVEKKRKVKFLLTSYCTS